MKIKVAADGARIKAQAKMEEKSVVPRLMIILLAVGLLWMTSLASVVVIVNDNFFIRPTLAEVGETLSNAFEFVAEDGYRYSQCADNEVSACENKYFEDRDEEIARIEEIQAINVDLVLLHKGYREVAVKQVNDSLNILQALTNNGSLVLEDYQVNSGVSCPRVEKWVSGQASASSAMGMLQQFNANTTALLQSRQEQLEARRLYDEQYLANKTAELALLQEQFGDAVDNPEAVLQDMNATLLNLQACFSDGGVYQGVVCDADDGSIVDANNEYASNIRTTIFKTLKMNSLITLIM